MKKLLSVLISLIPFQPIKIWCYRVVLGYRIDYRTKIGFFNIIICKTVTITSSKIGHFNYIDTSNLIMKEGARIQKFNRIKHLNTLVLESGAFILSKNFIGGSKLKQHFINRKVTIGKMTQILRSNYFDVVDEIVIGKNVVFGGNGSEIWTHGFDVNRKMLVGKITFGNNIFVGSHCIFTKGITISDETTIAPGSVVYKSILEPGVYSTHQINKVK